MITPTRVRTRPQAQAQALWDLHPAPRPTPRARTKGQRLYRGYQSAFVSTFAAPNDRPAGQSEYRSAFLSTLAHRNEKQAVCTTGSKTLSYTPLRACRGAKTTRLGVAFATLSRPPSPPTSARAAGHPHRSLSPAKPPRSQRPRLGWGRPKRNRQASYAARPRPFVGAPNATARIERVLNEAVGPPGEGWRARAAGAGFWGLWRRAGTRRPGVCSRAVFSLDHAEGEEEEEDGRAESEEDGAGDGADDNTATSPGARARSFEAMGEETTSCARGRMKAQITVQTRHLRLGLGHSHSQRQRHRLGQATLHRRRTSSRTYCWRSSAATTG